MLSTKHLNRTIRVLRLLAVVQVYHHYTMMQLNRELIGHDTCYRLYANCMQIKHQSLTLFM